MMNLPCICFMFIKVRRLMQPRFLSEFVLELGVLEVVLLTGSHAVLSKPIIMVS